MSEMKAIDILNNNKNMDLRRWGKDQYTEKKNGTSIDSLVQASNTFDIRISPEGVKKMARDGKSIDEWTKWSFDSSYEPSENAVSVPLEDYLIITDMNVFKILMSFFFDKEAHSVKYAHLEAESIEGGCVGSSSTSHNFSFRPCVEWNGKEYVATNTAYIIVYETGPLSSGYPEACFYIDPNDFTKCLVEPEDL